MNKELIWLAQQLGMSKDIRRFRNDKQLAGGILMFIEGERAASKLQKQHDANSTQIVRRKTRRNQ